MRASRRHLHRLAVLVGLLGALSLPAAAGPVDTHNLIRNGDFEEPGELPAWTPQAGTQATYSTTSNALTGRRALKIAVPTPGNGVITSAPCRVSSGSDYLLTFWYRAEGMSTKGRAYEGCSADMYILWEDGTGKQVGRDLCSLLYGPVPDYRAATYTMGAPAGAAQARLQMCASVGREYKGPPTAVFVDQVRLMKIARTTPAAHPQRWEYLNRKRGSGLQIVPDKDAVKSEAVLAAVGRADKNAGLTWGQYTPEQPIGDYLAIFRLKVKDNTKAEPAATLDVYALGSLSGTIVPQKVIRASDFKQASVYQEFAIRFIRPEEGVLEFRVFFQGVTDLWFDKTMVVQLASFPTDKEQAAIWFGEEAYTADQAAPAHERKTILVLKGLGHQVYLPDQANWKPSGAVVKDAYVAKLQTGFVLDQPFPKSLAALKDVKVIVLADVPAAALNGFLGRSTLRQFVEQGGGLLVFGGPFSLGKGEIAGSAFEPALPITTMGTWDLVKAKSPIVKVARDSPITSGLVWKDKPVLLYYQKTAAKPEAEVLLECDGFPMLATWRYGKGRVAVFAGTYLGEPAHNEVLFYQWPGYVELLTRLVEWLSGP